MNFFKIAGLILQKIRITSRIRTLEIENAGIDDDMPFVELRDGLRFYGHFPVKKDKKYYSLLSPSIRKKLPFDSYKVALDILIRYVEGGLKLGGPRKERFYKVQQGDLIAEMGAYMGFYTLYLAGKVGPEGRIIAIEPMPENLRYLKKNIEYNKLKQVAVVEKGVWDKSETQTFYQEGHDAQSASMILTGEQKNSFQIEVDTLDAILSDHNVQKVDMMLIQLNGIEYDALIGLKKLAPENLAIAARYRKGEELPVPLIKNLLNERGYQVHVVSRDYVFAKKSA